MSRYWTCTLCSTRSTRITEWCPSCGKARPASHRVSLYSTVVKDKVRQLLREGYTLHDVAGMLGVSATRIKHVCAEAAREEQKR